MLTSPLVAIAYVMQKAPYVFPIVGGRKIEHLYQNLEALDISLTNEQIKALEDIVPFNKGFPYSGFVSSCSLSDQKIRTEQPPRAMVRSTMLNSNSRVTSTSGRSNKLFVLTKVI